MYMLQHTDVPLPIQLRSRDDSIGTKVYIYSTISILAAAVSGAILISYGTTVRFEVHLISAYAQASLFIASSVANTNRSGNKHTLT